MTDIERLEKFIRRREKWRYWATARDATDLQVLRRKERIMWEAMFLAGLCLFHIIGEPHCFKPANLGVLAYFLGFMGYLVVGASRTVSLRQIFERTAVQNATDLLDELKRRDAAAAPQEKPGSGSGKREAEAEVGGQKSEIRDQRSKVRGPRSPVSGLWSPVPSGQGENTTDIQRLEKFIRQREKWRYWASTQEGTDLQTLRKQEHAMCELIAFFAFSLFNIMDRHNFLESFHLIMWVSILGFMVYLAMEASRTSRLREIFERTAVQNASDLINELKTRDAAAVPQDKPAS